MSKVKLYPVCNWERNQHKMYIRSHEEQTQEAWDLFYESERLLEAFNSNDRNGVAYVTYPDYCKIKDIIGYYDWTH